MSVGVLKHGRSGQARFYRRQSLASLLRLFKGLVLSKLTCVCLAVARNRSGFPEVLFERLAPGDVDSEIIGLDAPMMRSLTPRAAFQHARRRRHLSFICFDQTIEPSTKGLSAHGRF